MGHASSYARHVAFYPLGYDHQSAGQRMPKLMLLKKIVRKLCFSLARNNNQNIVRQYLKVLFINFTLSNKRTRSICNTYTCFYYIPNLISCKFPISYGPLFYQQNYSIGLYFFG